MAMLVDEQQTLGYDVVFLNLAEGARREGGRLSWGNATRTFTDAARVFRAARRGDVVHVHSALAPTVTALRAGLLVRAARLRGARTVVHAHGGRLIDSLTTPARRALAHRTLAPADAVIAVSTRVQDVLLESGLDPDRVRYLANGVSVDRFADVPSSRPHDPPRVLFVGGLTPRKGVLDLLAASSMLLDEGVRHELWLVGGMPDEGAESHRQVLDAVPPHAELKGQVDPADMADVYAAADVFCLPSWWEAMPLTVLEAQAAGLPVVATDVGDVASMVVDGTTGHLVPARDRAALAGALRSLLVDEDRRAEMGAQALRHVREGFAVETMLRDLAEVLDEVRA
jgi:glycosyltransferase involved in cell wall biosynthesis